MSCPAQMAVLALLAAIAPVSWGMRVADLGQASVKNLVDAATSGNASSGIKTDGDFFVIMEVYMLKGSESLQSSKAGSEAVSDKILDAFSPKTPKTDGYYIGERVYCRDRGESWKTGQVTSLDPLEVMPDQWGKSYTWAEVAPMTSLMQVADAEAESTNQHSGAFYHSEILICPRSFMNGEDEKYLQDLVNDLGFFTSYKQIPEDKWEAMGGVRCQTLSYGGSNDEGVCSGVSQYNQYLSSRRAGIGNADLDHVWKYVYGTGDKSATAAKDYVCRGTCGADWSGHNYNPVTRNCNFFSATVLNCAFELSQSTPNLGVSDMRRVWSCGC